MKKFLAKLGFWLLAKAREGIKDALTARALELVAEQSLVKGRSGESKRHQVYARLIKEFPQTSKRLISKAIEESL